MRIRQNNFPNIWKTITRGKPPMVYRYSIINKHNWAGSWFEVENNEKIRKTIMIINRVRIKTHYYCVSEILIRSSEVRRRNFYEKL